MEMDSAAVEWRRKEGEAARRTEKMEVEKEARGEGKVWKGGAEAAAEEEVADGGGGDVYKWEEGGAIGRNWRMQMQGHQRQPFEAGHQRQPFEAGHRPFWRPRGGGRSWRGGGRGGFQFQRCPWYGAVPSAGVSRMSGVCGRKNRGKPYPCICSEAVSKVFLAMEKANQFLVNQRHQKAEISNNPGLYGGAIIICNREIKQQFFEQKHFALPGYAATFIKKIRAGMLLFLFEYEERKLYGVFEATSDGALNILPDACASLCKLRPAQVLFKRVWFCKPLTEAEFSDAIKGHCLHPQRSFFGISYQQVLNLVDLFSSRMIRLQPYQKPKSKVLWDYKISLARTGREFRLYTQSNGFSRPSSIFCNNRISFPHIPFMDAKGKHSAHKHKSPLHPCPKPVVFKSPDIIEKNKPDDADYIPLELDDCNSDSDGNQSALMGTVSFHSTMESNISCEDQVPKPFNGKHTEDDRWCSPVLNQRFVSESEIGQNNVMHIMKGSESQLQAKGCKQKGTIQLEPSDVLSPMRARSLAKRVSFSFGGSSVTSDEVSCIPTLAGMQQNREVVLKERKEHIGFSARDIRSERDASAKSKLTKPSFADRYRNQHAQWRSRNSSSQVTHQACTLLSDEE